MEIYYDDMSVATAAAIKGLRPWITNEYAHDGLDRLLAMRTDD